MFDPHDVETAEFPSPLPGARAAAGGIVQGAHRRRRVSDRGKVRERNEDHFYVARGGRRATTLVTNVPSADIPSEFAETAYLLVVADGMGVTRAVKSPAGWPSPR